MSNQKSRTDAEYLAWLKRPIQSTSARPKRNAKGKWIYTTKGKGL